MRTLTAPLTAAQRARSRVPVLAAVISDRHAGVRRLRPALWRNGAEQINSHAAAVPTDGSLNRFRIDGTDLYRQRVVTPAIGSDYSIWTLFRANSRLVAASQTGATIDVFTEDTISGFGQIHRATSSDNGATWGAFALAFTNGTSTNALAAAAKSTTEIVVLEHVAANTRAWRLGAGVWVAFDTADGEITPAGLAVHYASDYNCVITGTPAAGGSRVVSRIFGDGFNQANDTWGAARTLLDAPASATIAYDSPAVSQPDTYRALYRENYTGAGAFARLYFTHTPATAGYADLWKEPTPFDLTEAWGLAITYTAATLYLTSARRVYAQSLTVDQYVATARVLECTYHEEPFSRRQATLILDNADGALNTLPTAITKGADVRLSPGYMDLAATPPVPLNSDGPTFWINQITHDYLTHPATVTLTLNTAWAELVRARTTRALATAAGVRNIFGHLQRLFAAAGFEFSGAGGSPESSNLQPAFALTPNESIATAIQRLLTRVPDALFNRGEFFIINEPLAADAPDALYNRPHTPATHHELTDGRYTVAVLTAAHVRTVAGAAAATIADAIDYAEALLVAPGPLIVADRELTAAQAQDRSDSIARGIALRARNGLVIAPVHCGLETNDIITVDDARTGAPFNARVLALTTRYRRQRHKPATYQQEIALGAP